MFDYTIKELSKGENTLVTPKGNSMTPIIKPGDQVMLKPTNDHEIEVGDIVLCRVKGMNYLHKVTAIDESKDRYQISNNKGHINGWTGRENIFGIKI